MTQLQERRVLLVDDNELIREMAADVLADEGLLIVQAGDAEQALDQLRTQPAFDLLLTDVRLPGMSGRDLADAARALAPALPVIFMTGYAEEALERRISRALHAAAAQAVLAGRPAGDGAR